MNCKIFITFTLFVFTIFFATIGMAELVGYWKLDDVSDTSVSDSVGNNDGTIQGDTSLVTNGKIDGALAFDGDGDYVQTPLSEELQTAVNFTISAWFQTNMTSEGQQHIVWIGQSDGNGWGSQQELHLSVNHFDFTNKLSFYFGSGTDTDGYSVNIVSREDFTDTSDWHHIAGVVENANGPTVSGQLYLDGELLEPLVEGFGFPTTDSTDNPPDRSGWDTPLRIGATGADTRYFNGFIDEVAVWTHALTDTEVSEMMDGITAVEPVSKLATTWSALKQ